MLETSKVEFIGTTDDPTDDLKSHRQLKEEETSLTVSPSFRPDTGLNIDQETFLPWMEKLAQAADTPIDNYTAFLKALESRVAFLDRKSTRLNSSHVAISYAVFCLKKKI